MSGRLVAAITLISSFGEKPSSWLSSSSIVLCTSRSPDLSLSKRLVPIASSSSMKMMDGCFSLANAKASLTIFAPSPIYIWFKSGPASFRKVALVWAAHARAIMVLPVPGGPCISTPLGGRIPMLWNLSLWVMGRTIASLNSQICLSSPPMSVYSSVGFVSNSIERTRESYSGGNFYRMMQESLFTPISSAGFSQ